MQIIHFIYRIYLFNYPLIFTLLYSVCVGGKMSMIGRDRMRCKSVIGRWSQAGKALPSEPSRRSQAVEDGWQRQGNREIGVTSAHENQRWFEISSQQKTMQKNKQILLSSLI